MIKVQSIVFDEPDGKLEGLVKFDDSVDAKATAVVCHPHPLYSGTMHNKVVFATAEAFFTLGCSVLRFNFRGVGLSAGRHGGGPGEIEDALAAVRYMRGRHDGRPCHMAGFSFGAWIAIEAVLRDPMLASLTAVAPTFKYFDSTVLSELFTPKLFLQGTRDEICPPQELQRHFPSFAEPKELVMLEGAATSSSVTCKN